MVHIVWLIVVKLKTTILITFKISLKRQENRQKILCFKMSNKVQIENAESDISTMVSGLQCKYPGFNSEIVLFKSRKKIFLNINFTFRG